MDEVTGAFANAYRSERLIYRDIENSDADRDLMHMMGPANHVTWGLLSSRLFRDVSKKANTEMLGKMLDSGMLLKVMICLPAPRDESGELDKLGVGDRGYKERETAIPIGSLTLTGIPETTFQAPATAVGLAIGEAYQNKVCRSKGGCEIGIANTDRGR
jgi:hypothetical protein